MQFSVSTQHETATAGLDFSGISADAVQLSSTAPNDLCVDVTVIEDRVIENQELFSVILTSADLAIHFNPNSSVTQVREQTLFK